ncbi:hypothetical protein BX661DRAFT_178824 [Kickxella alabastrina]|uniref:uncharacterized protein n=1 Tax=Kickxella alabastrina TaxID=61397 RepID=UPI00221FC7E9|nr:uncharacterized protein BX661DRAFT_178824 [Kickxella alabastrina]KAI7832936.1 hypothetical protein BX661DRAFT_178824 [Kickxella alabastrina]KAJ1943243.1 hypothetical protein GGF37_002734 [Kickxella alabastrina]
MDHNWQEMEESNIVFLGNVAYDTTEEQLRQMLELAGPVIDIRLVFDPNTSRARGFGFCQYADTNIAASAIKNLNDSLVDGRNIKIGYADRDRIRAYLGTDGLSLRNTPKSTQREPMGGPGGVDKAREIVSQLSSDMRMELIAQYRAYADVNTTKAKQELTKNPGLAWAVLAAMELEGLVADEQLKIIKGGAADVTMAAGTLRPTGMPHQRPPPPPFQSRHAASSQSMPPQPHFDYSTPAPALAPAPVPAPALVIADESAATEMDNAEVLKQLLSLTDEQLAQLPEEHRQQIIELKQQLQPGI